MTNGIFGIITIIGTLSLLINRPLALQIGAFNLGVYGKTKSSKSQVVSIITEVTCMSHFTARDCNIQ